MGTAYAEVRVTGNIQPLNVHTHGRRPKNRHTLPTHNVFKCRTCHKEKTEFLSLHTHTQLVEIFFPFMHSKQWEKKMIPIVRDDLETYFGHCGMFVVPTFALQRTERSASRRLNTLGFVFPALRFPSCFSCAGRLLLAYSSCLAKFVTQS